MYIRQEVIKDISLIKNGANLPAVSSPLKRPSVVYGNTGRYVVLHDKSRKMYYSNFIILYTRSRSSAKLINGDIFGDFLLFVNILTHPNSSNKSDKDSVLNGTLFPIRRLISINPVRYS